MIQFPDSVRQFLFCAIFLVSTISCTPKRYSGFSDLHNSVLFRLYQTQNYAGLNQNGYPVNISGIQSSQSKVLFLSVGFPQFGSQQSSNININDVMQFFKHFKDSAKIYYPSLHFNPDKKSVSTLLRSKQTVCFYALEGTHLLQNNMQWVDSLATIGVKMIGLGHWFQNSFLRDTTDTIQQQYPLVPVQLNEATTLTLEGKVLLEKFIQNKILIDVSHLGKNALEDVIKLNAGRTPLIASHSNTKEWCNHSRNLTDTQIKAIAETGGLIGVCIHQPIVGEPADLNMLINHITHIIKIAGIDHVAIGTDFEGNIKPVSELNNISLMHKIYEALLQKGFSQKQAEKIMWKNVVNLVSR